MFGSYLSKLTPTLYKYGYNFINYQIKKNFQHTANLARDIKDGAF